MNEIEKVQQNLPVEGNQPSQVTNNIYTAPNSTTIAANYGPVLTVDPEKIKEMFGGIIADNLAGLDSVQKANHSMKWANLNRERYCLFVLENENFDDGSFCIPNKKALKYTDDFTRDSLIALSPADMDEIKNMPCIFAKRNADFKDAGEDTPFLIGVITDIKLQHDNIKFKPAVFTSIGDQNILNRNMSKLGLRETTYRNQLDEDHWAVINGNLFKTGKELGIEVK